MTALSGADRSVKVWQARIAVLMALPTVCPVQVRELLADAGARRARDIRNHAPLIRAWAKTHRLDRDWLIDPIGSVVTWAIDYKADVLKRPTLWRDQLWQVSSYCEQELAKLSLFAEWRAEARHPFRAIEADPMSEKRAAFLERAEQHYDQRQADMTRRGWTTISEMPELARHAAQFLAFQVLQQSPAQIADADRVELRAVETAITRLSKLTGLPRRPVRRGRPRTTKSPH